MCMLWALILRQEQETKISRKARSLEMARSPWVWIKVFLKERAAAFRVVDQRQREHHWIAGELGIRKGWAEAGTRM